MQEPSDSARLLARGVEITLADGPHRLRLDMEAAEFLEEELGGLQLFLEGLNRYAERGWAGKKIGIIKTGVTACLLHETAEARFKGANSLEQHRYDVSRNMEIPRLLDYVTALLGAIVEAFPGMEAVSVEDPKASTADSPGTGSSTTRRSRSVARKASSGA